MANFNITRKTQRMGGHARALALSPRRRKQIARAAARQRWANEKKKKRGNNS